MKTEFNIVESYTYNFPAIYVGDDNKTILLVTQIYRGCLIGTVIAGNNIGEYAENWSEDSFNRLEHGSTLNISYEQE